MDDPEPPRTRLSAVDELLSLRDSILSARSSDHPLKTNPDLASVSDSGASQQVLSPSTVLPSTENETQAFANSVTVAEPLGAATENREDAHGPASDSGAAITSNDAYEPLNSSVPSAAPPLMRSVDSATDFVTPSLHSTTLSLGQSRHQEPAHTTVAPSDLTVSSLAGDIPFNNITDSSNSALLSEVAEDEDLTDGVVPNTEEKKESPAAESQPPYPSFVTSINTQPNEYIVTLPIAANTRQQYAQTIMRNRRNIEAFTSTFTGDTSILPEEPLVSKIEVMFQQLLDLCDLPAWEADLPPMSADAMKKHATGTNSKYSFVLELLLALRDADSWVFIVSQPGRTLDFLEAIVETEGFRYRVLGRDHISNADSKFAVNVVLAGTDQDMAQVTEAEPDAVVLFDHTARSLNRAGPLADRIRGKVILPLVAACSLEHIDMHLSRGMEPMERKNALVIALVQSRLFIEEPERKLDEPYQVAELFAEYVKNPEKVPEWEPYEIADFVFDVYPSQLQPQPRETPGESAENEDASGRSNGRKRQMDDADEAIPKRARIGESESGLVDTKKVQILDTIGEFLASHAPKGKASGQVIEISLEQLESMFAKTRELEERLKEKEKSEESYREMARSLEDQLKSHAKTIRGIQSRFMDAVRDRGKFDAERETAVKAAMETSRRMEALTAEVVKTKEQNALLESRLADATAAHTSTDSPDLTRFADQEQKLREAEARIESLQKKVANGENELQYTRQIYQEATTAMSDHEREKAELAKRIKDLEQKASNNLLEIHRINVANQASATDHMLEEQKAIVRDRERELERARDELRNALGRNAGRRETRQGSVPRSPRLGVMSPRPGGPAGGSGTAMGLGLGPSSRGTAGAGSRGTSPAPVPGFDAPGGLVPLFGQPPGAGRWGHLRD